MLASRIKPQCQLYPSGIVNKVYCFCNYLLLSCFWGWKKNELAQNITLLMLLAKSIHHWDHIDIQHITQDWLLQLALSGACWEESLRIIFHSCQLTLAHVKFLYSLTWEKAVPDEGFFTSFSLNSLLIKV